MGLGLDAWGVGVDTDVDAGKPPIIRMRITRHLLEGKGVLVLMRVGWDGVKADDDEEDSHGDEEGSDDPEDFDEEESDAPSGPKSSPSRSPSPSGSPTPGTGNADRDENTESDGEETQISSINGHWWYQGNVEFQVLWSDKDATWEPLSNVNDSVAMEVYLAHHDVADPIRLPKRKYLIDKAVKAILFGSVYEPWSYLTKREEVSKWLERLPSKEFPRLARYPVFALFGLAGGKYSPSHQNFIKILARGLKWFARSLPSLYDPTLLAKSPFCFCTQPKPLRWPASRHLIVDIPLA
ncbi:hypothetical protein B0H10DRAFT_1937788 [Mycena sp. CBHHK59/15]|nr:hypothetical protein B0H10DRAFT_1937788 [Mycena sp. CBHHK59/15]